MVPVPAIKGKATGTIEARFSGISSRYKRMPRDHFGARKNNQRTRDGERPDIDTQKGEDGFAQEQKDHHMMIKRNEGRLFRLMPAYSCLDLQQGRYGSDDVDHREKNGRNGQRIAQVEFHGRWLRFRQDRDSGLIADAH